MSQIIVAQNVHGIVLGAEDKAIQLDDEGKEFSLKVDRLLPLTSHCALLVFRAVERRDMASAFS